MILLNSNNSSDNLIKFVHPHKSGKACLAVNTEVKFSIEDQGWFNAMVQNSASALAVMM